MSQPAIVPCPKCKAGVPVEFRHAGQDRTCPSCQSVFAAPKLRELKLLLPESSADIPRMVAAKGGSHRLRNLLFVLGLGTALLAGLGTYLVWQYASTLTFDEKVANSYTVEVNKNVDAMTPAALWDDWDTILSAPTLPAWELMGTDNFKRYSATLQWIVRILGGLTVAGLLCLVSSFFLSKSPRRI